ncbi:MAG TPA: hypothetical protein VIF83_08615 [Gemmatimonadaceae bacterium]
MSSFARQLGAGALRGALIGLPILGVGGRIMMRIIAHWEGRTPVLTPEGTFTIVAMGTLLGALGGVVHALLLRFVRNTALRLSLFGLIAVLFTLRAVNELLIRPRLLFLAIMVVYAIILEMFSRMRRETAFAT